MPGLSRKTLCHRRFFQISRTRKFSRARLTLQWLKLRRQRVRSTALSDLGLDLLSLPLESSLETPRIRLIPLPLEPELEDANVLVNADVNPMSSRAWSTLFQCPYRNLNHPPTVVRSQTEPQIRVPHLAVRCAPRYSLKVRRASVHIVSSCIRLILTRTGHPDSKRYGFNVYNRPALSGYWSQSKPRRGWNQVEVLYDLKTLRWILPCLRMLDDSNLLAL